LKKETTMNFDQATFELPANLRALMSRSRRTRTQRPPSPQA
jgi:hypothetical protein